MSNELVITIEVTGKEPSWHKMTPIGNEPVEQFANRVRVAIMHLEHETTYPDLDLDRVKRLVAEFNAAEISALALAGEVPNLIAEIERLQSTVREEGY